MNFFLMCESTQMLLRASLLPQNRIIIWVFKQSSIIQRYPMFSSNDNVTLGTSCVKENENICESFESILPGPVLQQSGFHNLRKFGIKGEISKLCEISSVGSWRNFPGFKFLLESKVHTIYISWALKNAFEEFPNLPMPSQVGFEINFSWGCELGLRGRAA